MRKCFWAGTLLLVPALFLVGRQMPAEAPAPVKSAPVVIAPPQRAFLTAADFYVICKDGTAKLAVDGAARAWGPYAEPLRVARLRLGPGTHEVRIGSRTITVRIAKKTETTPSAGWSAYHLHPIEAGARACAGCHETGQRGGLTEVGTARPFSACQECHKPAQFEVKHSHPLEPLKHCGSCHAVHGSAHKGLLRAPVKKLCAECHDS
jgi:predicted CXXCH cytochrome family protein